MVVFWNYLPSIDRIWKTSPVPAAAASFLVLSFFVILAFFLDRWLSLIYVRLKEKNTLAARWLSSAFFSGLIPGTAMISFLGLYYAGGMRLDPFTASFFRFWRIFFPLWPRALCSFFLVGLYMPGVTTFFFGFPCLTRRTFPFSS